VAQTLLSVLWQDAVSEVGNRGNAGLRKARFSATVIPPAG